jgi:hypothetical protein
MSTNKSNSKITTGTQGQQNAKNKSVGRYAPITQPEKEVKPPMSDKDYVFSYRGYPISEAKVESMIDELYTWPETNPTSYSISDFYHKQFISRASYYVLLQKHPKLKIAHDIASEKMSEKLWARSIEKKLDWNAVKFRMPRMNSDFAEDLRLQAQIQEEGRLKAQAEQQAKGDSGVQYVVIKDPVYVEVEQKVKKEEYAM